MRSIAETNQWEYWIPIWTNILQTRDLFNGQLAEGMTKMFTGQNPRDDNAILSAESRALAEEARQQSLEDRAYTEMREDTAYQRAVADMRSAGINPYTVGASPASSTASKVGENSVQTQLSMLGYILDLKNLDAKNRKITNDAIGNILGFVGNLGSASIKKSK